MKPRTFLPTILGCCCALFAWVDATRAATFETVHTFASGPLLPSSPLVRGLDGNYYGSSSYGGDRNWGTIYRVTPAGDTSVLLSFHNNGGPVPGGRPGELIQDADANFYGVTYSGGLGAFQIGGTVFKFTPQGQYTHLHTFDQSNAPLLGYNPVGPLARDAAGNLFGVTRSGGAFNLGTVFKIAANGQFSVLVSFSGQGGATRGESPDGGLIPDGNGGFLGTTHNGGLHGRGTVYRVMPDGAHTVLADFSGAGGTMPGAAPRFTLTPDGAGNFYGVAHGGSGNTVPASVFRVNANGTVGLVANVDSLTIGDFMSGSLVREPSGTFLGVMAMGPLLPGGISHAHGSIFRVTPAGVVSIAVEPHLSPAEPMVGYYPMALTPDGASGYMGVMQVGGNSNGGSLFRIDGAGQFTHLAALLHGAPASPSGTLVADAAGNLYGTASMGGAAGEGAIFRFKPGVPGVTTLVSFTGTIGSARGSLPYPELAIDGAGNLFGTTKYGSATNEGTVFKVTPAGVLTTLKGFTDSEHPEGNMPQGVVLDAAGNLYGSTTRELGDEEALIYKITPSGTFSILGNTGALGPYDHYPTGRLGLDLAGNLIGATFPDDEDPPFLYRVNAAGTVSLLQSFPGSSYSLGPYGRPLLGPDGANYGLLRHGAIYRLSSSGVFREFATLDTMQHGYGVFGELTMDEMGNLFGVTRYNAAGQQGAVFRVSPRGLVATLHAFSELPPNVDFVTAGVTRHPDGALYGTAGGFGTGFIYRVRGGPTPTTQEATNVAVGQATFRARVNPHAESTSVVFEFGPTPALGSETAAVNLGSGNAFLDVAIHVTGLTPSLAYFYRPRATSASGTQYGDVLNTLSNDPFGLWRIQHFGNVNFTELDDPDRDGVPLLTEYALNLSPVVSDAHRLPKATRTSNSFAITFIRDPARTDLTLTVESATDLTGPWTVISTSTEGQPFDMNVTNDGPGIAPGIRLVTVSDPTPISAGTKRFLRVRARR